MKRRACLLLVLLLALAAFAEQVPTWALGDEPLAFTLVNGLPVILQQDDSAPLTVVQLLVRCGDRDDPGGKSGLAFLTARLCLEITESSTLQKMMAMGSAFSLDVGGGHSLFTLRCLSRNLEPSLRVLSAMMREPLFSGLRIDGVKELMRFRQDMETDDPVQLMRKTAAGAFYSEPAYGAARFGDRESLKAIGRKDVQAFFRGRYLAGNMVAVVISDLARERVEPLIARHLGRLAAGPSVPARPVALRRLPERERIVERRTKQALVSFIAPLPELTTDNYVLAFLLEQWLGKGIGSRLWPLRSRGGLVYGFAAEVQPNREAMLLSVHLKTETGRAAAARGELARLLTAAGSEEIAAGELAAAKAYAQAAFLRENETREQRAATMAFMEGSGLSRRLAGEFIERLKRIGIEEFDAFRKNALAPERWLRLSIGPAAEQAVPLQ